MSRHIIPSGSRRVEVGSDHQSPLKVRSRFFWARTENSTTSTTTLMPTSFHMAAMASDMALSLARRPTVVRIDRLALVPGLFDELPRLAGIVGQRRQVRVEVRVALGDGAGRDDPAAAPQVLDDGLPVHAELHGLFERPVVQRRDLGVRAEHVEARVERRCPLGAGVLVDAVPVVWCELGHEVRLALKEPGHRGAIPAPAEDDAVDPDPAASSPVGLGGPVVLVHDEAKGPVPLGLALNVSLPTSPRCFGGRSASVKGEPRGERRSEALVWITTVTGSGASMRLTVVKTLETRVLRLGSYVR